MKTTMQTPGTRAGAVAAALILCLATACATIENPGGGPADETPPVVESVWPDSGSVGLRGVDRLEIVFSEKVTPNPAERMIRLYPEVEIRKTRWKGRRKMIVEFADTLPPDTVLVLEVPRGYQDIHRVRSTETILMPLATADSFPVGEVRGLIVLEDEPAEVGVAELYAVPPDSVSWERTQPLRRTAADSLGHFTFRWLPDDGGPWLLRIFDDANGDMRVAEGEPQRLMPGEVRLERSASQRDLGELIVYKPNTPGNLRMLGTPQSSFIAPLAGWSETIAETDTGWTPRHVQALPKGWAAASSDTTIFPEAGPKLTRLIIFADLDGDSLLTAHPDSSLADSLRWFWEPYTVLDSLEVEAGLTLELAAPVLPDTMSFCATPPPSAAPSLPDTTASEAAAADSLDLAPATPAIEPPRDEKESP